MVVKNKALNPNAARGKAVAVPRESGKLRAAKGEQVSGCPTQMSNVVAYQLLWRQ